MNPADNTAQYSDPTPNLNSYTFTGFKFGDGPGVVSGSATCSTTRTVNSPAGTYPITCNVNGLSAANYSFVTGTGTFTVTAEDSFVQYSGDTIGQVGANLTLQATVWDSASSGFPGTSSSGADSTIGDITKMWIEFDVYNGGTCGSGTPIASKFAQVADTGGVGDGIGTATSTYSSSSENTYCVLAKLVAGSSGGTNQYYKASNAENAVINFYNNTGQFVTGGGWIVDPDVAGHGNFGFNARYNKNNQPQGQFVYVWRSTYNGVAADYIIKSNSLTALGFTQTTGSSNGYPMTATLQGKCNVQINRASDGMQLASQGNLDFIAKATDSGLPSSNSGDALSLTLTGSSLASKSFTNLPLNGGNVVIHMK